MPNLRIDNQNVAVPDGATVLDAAREAGVEVPTLCFLDGCGRFASCMVCVVRDRGAGKLVPACCAPALEGMDVETNGAEVRAARKAALELLLGEHVGDCEAPCRRGCPAHMNIPLMIRRIAAGDWTGAIETVRRDIAFPAVLGRICAAPCERACRRGAHDEPVAVCLLKRAAADAALTNPAPRPQPRKPPTGRRVAVVGAGPAGLSAAYYLLLEGHACTVFDERDEPGGGLRYGVPGERLPAAALEADIDAVRGLDVELRMNTHADRDALDRIAAEFDAVVLAVGKIDPDQAAAFGMEVSARGVKVRTPALETSRPGVFAGGDAVHPRRMTVAAVADGKTLAGSVRQFLNGSEATGRTKRFDSRLGRLQDGETDEFLEGASGVVRTAPASGVASGFSEAEARREAARCLHCDCREAEGCRLRRYAEQYGAKQRSFAAEDRPRFAMVRGHETVVWEPGKCIKCGLCVRISQREAEPVGLAFIGRGADVRVGVPFDKPLAEALTKSAAACVRACPTGALAFRAERGGP